MSYQNNEVTKGNYQVGFAHLRQLLEASAPTLDAATDRELSALSAALYGMAVQVEIALDERGRGAAPTDYAGGGR